MILPMPSWPLMLLVLLLSVATDACAVPVAVAVVFALVFAVVVADALKSPYIYIYHMLPKDLKIIDVKSKYTSVRVCDIHGWQATLLAQLWTPQA